MRKTRVYGLRYLEKKNSGSSVNGTKSKLVAAWPTFETIQSGPGGETDVMEDVGYIIFWL